MPDHMVLTQSIAHVSSLGEAEMPSQPFPSQVCDPWTTSPAPQVMRQDSIISQTVGPPRTFQTVVGVHSGVRAGVHDSSQPLSYSSMGPSQLSRLPSSAENRSKRKALMLEKQRDRSRAKKARISSSSTSSSKVPLSRKGSTSSTNS
jgi:hypothetical protein